MVSDCMSWVRVLMDESISFEFLIRLILICLAILIWNFFQFTGLGGMGGPRGMGFELRLIT